MRCLARAICAFVLLSLAPASAHAQSSVADFYRGKTVNFIIGNPPGGTYDLYARLIAKHLGPHLPGAPNVVAQNMPGASSLIAAGYVANVAPRDGTYVAFVSSPLPYLPLMDPEAAKKFDPMKVNWLPSPAAEGVLWLVRSDSPVRTADDLLAHETLMSVIAPGMLPALLVGAVDAALGAKVKPLVGHPNLAAAMLALERGETEGHAAVPPDALHRAYARQWAEGKYRVILQFGAKKSDEFPDAPLVTELVTNPADRQLLDLAMAPLKSGYASMVAPDTPPERVAALRKAFMETFADPAFLTDAKSQTLTIAPVDGEAMQSLVRQAYATPPAVVERMRTIYRQGM